VPFKSLALSVLAVALTACQPLPRPFEHDPGTPNDLLRLSDSSGIVVLPVADAPPDTAHRLAERMVASLIDLGIPAYVGTGNRTSLFLAGEVIDPGRDAHIVWALYDAQGAALGRHEQTIEGTPVDLWARADPDLMTQLADDAAVWIARHIQQDEAAEVVPPPIFIGPVEGIAAHEAERLQVALRQSLRRLGSGVAAQRSAESLVASARVTLTPLVDQRMEVAIVWVVADPNGTEIGRIDQASPFAAAAVRDHWNRLALDAGLAAAAGMIEMVSRIDWSKGFSSPPPRQVSRGGG
jgi:hypothetical protein